MDSTGFSPFFLVYGHGPVLPLDTLLGLNTNILVKIAYPNKLQRLNKAFTMARENLVVRADNKMRHDQKASDEKFLVGDAVYYKNHIIKKGHLKSLSPKWRPNYRIVAQTGPVTFVIRNQLIGKTGKAHANDSYLENSDIPWERGRPEHKPVDKTKYKELLDPVLQQPL